VNYLEREGAHPFVVPPRARGKARYRLAERQPDHLGIVDAVVELGELRAQQCGVAGDVGGDRVAGRDRFVTRSTYARSSRGPGRTRQRLECPSGIESQVCRRSRGDNTARTAPFADFHVVGAIRTQVGPGRRFRRPQPRSMEGAFDSAEEVRWILRALGGDLLPHLVRGDLRRNVRVYVPGSAALVLDEHLEGGRIRHHQAE